MHHIFTELTYFTAKYKNYKTDQKLLNLGIVRRAITPYSYTLNNFLNIIVITAKYTPRDSLFLADIKCVIYFDKWSVVLEI